MFGDCLKHGPSSGNGNYKAIMILDDCRALISWWVNIITSQAKHLLTPPHELELRSDT